jgi:RND superfamily putative drug exporter
LAAWVVTILGLGAGALTAGSGFTDSTDLPDSESAAAYSLLTDVGFGATSAGDAGVSGRIVWHSEGVAIDDPQLAQRVGEVLDAVTAMPGVQSVTSPCAAPTAGAGNPGQINAVAHTAYAGVVLTDDADLEQIRSVVGSLADDSTQVAAGGQAFYEQPAAGGVTEGVGILAALALLLLVLGSWWAAILPIVTGIAGVVVSLLLVILGSHVIDLSATSITMAALIGLGVGIDYALFVVNRHRKALLAGASVSDGVRTALNTSGRAVLFAGLTVMIALACMFVVGMSILTGMAMAAALTVLFTMAAAVTLLPALLGMLKFRVLSKKQRRMVAAADAAPGPHVHQEATENAIAGRWARLVQQLRAAPRWARWWLSVCWQFRC